MQVEEAVDAAMKEESGSESESGEEEEESDEEESEVPIYQIIVLFTVNK